MIRRIVLDNFMSHAHSEFDLAGAGLTVICGPNNCGKSAVVSAIETVCFNTPGDFMVRHDADQAQVTIDTDDGHALVWRRSVKGGASYVIDGREVHRLGKGGLPDDLHQHLRLPKVEHDGRAPFDVHIGRQKQPIFLIDDESGTAAFFSAASDAQRLLEIQKRHKSKVTEQRAVERSLKGELEKLDESLAALQPLDAVGGALEAIEREHAALCESVQDEQGMSALVEKLDEVAWRASRQQARAVVLAALRLPPEQPDTVPLAHLLDRARRAVRQVEQSRAQLERAARLAPPPELADPQPLADAIDMLERAQRACDLAVSTAESLNSLREPPVPGDPAPLSNAIRRLGDATLKSIESGTRLERAVNELARVKARIVAWAQENPTCPVCGGVVEPDRLIEGAHTHV